MGSLSIIYRKISELKPYPRNARTHKRKQIKQIKASIEEFGFTKPNSDRRQRPDNGRARTGRGG